jgi:hypothetical protein
LAVSAAYPQHEKEGGIGELIIVGHLIDLVPVERTPVCSRQVGGWNIRERVGADPEVAVLGQLQEGHEELHDVEKMSYNL